MVEDDAERVDWGNDDDEQQAPSDSYAAFPQRQAAGGYAGEDAEDAVSLGGDEEDEREFYAHQSSEQVAISGGIFAKSSSTTHSHPSKRDAQRQTTSSSQRARTPSQPKSSESPGRGIPRTHSGSTHTPVPLTHALPPKPVQVPPLYRPPSPAGPGILASAMVHRQKKSNGSGKPNAPDGGDPLPPDWEIRYPRDGSKDAYYYNVKTTVSTWVRPKLPSSGRSSPVKDKDNSNGQHSGRRSPDYVNSVWSD
ncbi:hypothetical protein BD413DRAFT_467773, partial [Trametes elegans]